MSSFVLRVTTKAQFLIITAIGVSLGADNSLDPASKKDLDWLQGTWKLVSAMRDGETLPKDKVQQTTIVIKDDTFLFPDLAEYATSKEGTISSTRGRSQSRWMPPRPRKKSCSASTNWTETVTRSPSLQPASHAPVNWHPSRGPETSCKSGSGRRNSNPG